MSSPRYPSIPQLSSSTVLSVGKSPLTRDQIHPLVLLAALLMQILGRRLCRTGSARKTPGRSRDRRNRYPCHARSKSEIPKSLSSSVSTSTMTANPWSAVLSVMLRSYTRPGSDSFYSIDMASNHGMRGCPLTLLVQDWATGAVRDVRCGEDG